MARSRRHLLTVLRWGLAVAVVVAVAYALARNWSSVAVHLRQVTWGALVGSGLLAMLPPLLSMLGWRVLLADLGSPVAPGPAAGMFFVGQLGKYVPGAVWSVVAQAEIGARLHIPRRRTAVGGLIAVGMAAVTGIVVGLPVVPLVLGPGEIAGSSWTVVVVLLLAVLVLWPRLLNTVIWLLLRLLRRDPLDARLSRAGVARAVGWFVLAWLAAGCQVWVLSHELASDAEPTELLLVAVSGFALASAAGILSVVLPAGVGVRDGVLVLALSAVMPVAAATAVAVLVRFLTVVADVVWAAVGWVWARSHHLVSTRAELRARGIDESTEDIEQVEAEIEEEVAGRDDR